MLIQALNFKSNNIDLVYLKLWVLTNFIPNIYILIIILNIILKKNIKSQFLFLIFNLHIVVKMIELPLSNTLFTIHPPLLYISLVSAVLNVWARERTSIITWHPTFTIPLAMFLGGFWSLQELNWGGWWNWDILELGNLIFWVTYLLLIHGITKNTIRLQFLRFYILFSVLTISYIYNKTGLATSIHSFIVSKTIKLNFFLLLFLGLIAIQIAPIVGKLLLIFIVCLNLKLVTTNVLKQFLILSLIFSNVVNTTWSLKIHQIWKKIIIFICLFNFTNIITSLQSQSISIGWWFKWSRHFLTLNKNFNSNLIWFEGWRSKNSNFWSNSFINNNTRSLIGPSYIFCYLK